MFEGRAKDERGKGESGKGESGKVTAQGVPGCIPNHVDLAIPLDRLVVKVHGHKQNCM